MTVTAVAEPESLGIDTERLEELRTRVRREIDDGLLPSCQFALARDGGLAAFETVGDAGSGTRYVIFSATKAFVASAAWLLIGESLEPLQVVGGVIVMVGIFVAQRVRLSAEGV